MMPPQGYGFARNLSLVQITGDELPLLAQDMPLAFRKLGTQWQAVAVLGLVPSVNLHVLAAGAGVSCLRCYAATHSS
jgi:hypothetical protein